MSATISCSLLLIVAHISGAPGNSQPTFSKTTICPAETPFQTLPSVTEITGNRINSDNTNSENATNEPCEEKNCPHSCFFDAVFTKAARFPVNEFGTSGQVYETDAAIIYEDMILQSQGNGKYLVKFVVETPNIPVTMRLQFVVQKPQCWDSDQNPVNYKSIGTITLPPITINAAKKDNKLAGRCWVVTYQGYSRVLNECKCKIKDYKMIRRGTARFGSLANYVAY